MGETLVVDLDGLDVLTPRRHPVAAVVGCPEDIGRLLVQSLPRQVDVAVRARRVVDVEIIDQFGRDMRRTGRALVDHHPRLRFFPVRPYTLFPYIPTRAR